MEIFCDILGIPSPLGNPSGIPGYCYFLKCLGKSKPFMTTSDFQMIRGQFAVSVANVIVVFSPRSEPFWRYNIVFPM